MKKVLLNALAIGSVAVFMASCGSSMTEEQIKQEAQKMFDEKKNELQVKADEACAANTDQYKQVALDSMMAANSATTDMPQ